MPRWRGSCHLKVDPVLLWTTLVPFFRSLDFTEELGLNVFRPFWGVYSRYFDEDSLFVLSQCREKPIRNGVDIHAWSHVEGVPVVCNNLADKWFDLIPELVVSTSKNLGKLRRVVCRAIYGDRTPMTLDLLFAYLNNFLGSVCMNKARAILAQI